MSILAADGRPRLCYEAGGTTLTMTCDLAAGHGMYCVKKTYNEEFARFSLGVPLEVAQSSMCHDSGADRMDSCTIQRPTLRSDSGRDEPSSPTRL